MVIRMSLVCCLRQMPHHPVPARHIARPGPVQLAGLGSTAARLLNARTESPSPDATSNAVPPLS